MCWTVVSQKDIHKVGDLVVYFEIDSWLDSTIPAFGNDDGFKARFQNWEGRTGMRLKTIKLRKQVSQGLIMSQKHFQALAGKQWAEGDDVTELLGILKWEIPEKTSGGQMPSKGRPFPYFIQKTDQERAQNYIGELPRHEGETFEQTLKVDGSSLTAYHVNKQSPYYEAALELKRARRKVPYWKQLLNKIIGYFTGTPDFVQATCSRNLQLDEDQGGNFINAVRKYNIYERLENLNRNIAVQGELLAPDIQQNHEKVKDIEYYVFDVFDIDKQKYLLPTEAREVVEELGLLYVPVVNDTFVLPDIKTIATTVNIPFGTTPEETERAVNKGRVDILLAAAEGPGMNDGVKREGYVYKSNSTPFSFKAISNAYLLDKEKKMAKEEAVSPA